MYKRQVVSERAWQPIRTTDRIAKVRMLVTDFGTVAFFQLNLFYSKRPILFVDEWFFKGKSSVKRESLVLFIFLVVTNGHINSIYTLCIVHNNPFVLTRDFLTIFLQGFKPGCLGLYRQSLSVG